MRALRDDVYRPVELERLELALAKLHLWAYPHVAGSFISPSGRRNEDAPVPDEERESWRRYLKRVLADIDRTADQIRRAGEWYGSPPPPTPRRKRRCPTCGVR